MPERLHKKNTPEAQRKFNDHLGIISDHFGTASPDQQPPLNSLVGGAAINAIFKKYLSPYRANGTPVDIDGIIFDSDMEKALTTMESIDAIRTTEPAFPEVGFELTPFSDSLLGYSWLTMLSGMRVDSQGVVYMNFRDIEQEIPQETLELHTVHLNGIPFQMFPEKTIWWRYFLRGGGILKPKDATKVALLDQYIKTSAPAQPDAKHYEAYRDFSDRISQKYGGWLKLYEGYWKFDQMTGGKISGSKGFFYKLIPFFNNQRKVSSRAKLVQSRS